MVKKFLSFFLLVAAVVSFGVGLILAVTKSSLDRGDRLIAVLGLLVFLWMIARWRRDSGLFSDGAVLFFTVMAGLSLAVPFAIEGLWAPLWLGKLGLIASFCLIALAIIEIAEAINQHPIRDVFGTEGPLFRPPEKRRRARA